MHARTLPVNSLVQGVWRQAASLVPRYRDRGAGRPPDRLPKRSCQVAEPRRLPGTRPPNPAAVTMVTYPSCHCRTNKKRPGSNKSSPPSLHCAPGGRQTPLGSNKDPGRVSRAPPWAAWRGAKHAVLQSYVCTTPRANQNGQHPLMEGALSVLVPHGACPCTRG